MTDDPAPTAERDVANPRAARAATPTDPDNEGGVVTAADPENVEAEDGVDDEELVPAESTIGVGTVVALGCIAGAVLVVGVALIVLLVVWVFS